jgi:hypothetical protein
MPIQLVETGAARSDAHTRELHRELRREPPHGSLQESLRESPHDSARPTSAARYIAFATLQEAYRSRGGIATGDVLAARLSAAGRGGYIDLALRIVAGQLFTFKWHGRFWLPMFQFDPVTLSLQEGPRRVLNELHAALDGWSIAHWYVQPNARLGRQRPLDLLDSDLSGVLAAAHVRAVQ